MAHLARWRQLARMAGSGIWQKWRPLALSENAAAIWRNRQKNESIMAAWHRK
jgi:hypothetical protein